MANVSTFTANFEPFDRALKAAEPRLNAFEQTTKRVKASLQRMVSDVDGTKVVSQARTMAAAVDQVGGASKLTNAELARMRPTVEEAVAKLKRLGQEVPPEIAKLHTAIQRSRVDLEKLGSLAGSAGKALTVGLTLPIVGAGTAAIKMATDFNRSMANVASLIPGNTARVLELKRSVQDLAIETGKSTDDLSAGLYTVISAFGDSADSARVLEINAKAAAAGLATTTDAITLTSAVTKGYGDTSAEAVAQVSDLAFAAVRLGQTTFPELAQAIGRVVPLSAELTVSQQELFGVMATATGVTGRASEVSTQLRGVLQSLLAPTADMAKLYQALGVESGRALLEQRGLQGAIEAIVDTARQSDLPLQKFISSIEGQTLALALAGPQADTFTAKLAQMRGSAGETNRAFREQTEGVNAAGFQWDQFQQRVAVAAQRLGDRLVPAATKVLETLTPIGRKALELIDRFGELPAPIQKTATVAVAAFAAGGPLLLALSGTITAVHTLKNAITALYSVQVLGGLSSLASRILAVKSAALLVSGAGLVAGSGALLAGAIAYRATPAAPPPAAAYDFARESQGQRPTNIGGARGLIALDLQALQTLAREYQTVGRTAGVELGKAERATRQLLVATRQVVTAWTVPIAARPDTIGHLLFGRDLGSLNARFEKLFAQPSVTQGDLVGPAVRESVWRSLFGSPQQMGAALSSTVLQAVTGGGNVSRALGAGLGGQLASGVAQSLTREGGKLAGTALGGALGAALPVVGSLAGAAIGGLVNKFFGPSKGAIAGKQADADIKALQDRLLQTYGSIDNIRKIGGAAGAALADAWGSKNVQGLAHFQRLLANFEGTLAAVRTDIEALARTSAAGELVSPELLQRLLGQQDNADVQAALAAFQGSQRDAGVAGLGGFVAARAELGDLADTVLPLTERSALAAGAALAAFFEEFDSPVAALQAMGPSLTSWQAQLDAAGLSGGTAFAHISAMASLATDEIGGPVTNAVLGLGQGMTSLHNLGLLNQDTYGGLTELMGTGFSSLTDKGFDVHQIMTLWRKPLQTAWELQQDFGFETDETTQSLIDQAESSGLIGDKFRPAADRMAAGIDKLVARLDEFLSRLTGGVTEEAQTAAGVLVDTFTNMRMPTVRVPVIFDVDDSPGSGGAVVHVPGAARGGIVARPTLLVAGEAGAEAIIPLDQLRSVVGAGAGDVYLDSEKVGRVIWREGATRFGAAGAW